MIPCHRPSAFPSAKACSAA